MSTTGPRGLLVGVDGSTEGLHAVDWAAAEAAGRGVRLTVCHVLEMSPSLALPPTPELVNSMRGNARRVLTDAVARARQSAPDIPVDEHLAAGSAARTLTVLAADAEEVVVGHRGLGGFAELLLGSVGGRVAADAAVPVVVVRPATKPDGPVLVGIDEAGSGHPGLGYAFRHAARHGLDVQVLHVFRDPAGRSGLGYPMPDSDYDHAQQGALTYLAEAAAPWQERFPSVRVERFALSGNPTHGLVDASLGCSLLVVGRHGPAGLAGMLLGSVCQAVIRHAHSPVAVVG